MRQEKQSKAVAACLNCHHPISGYWIKNHDTCPGCGKPITFTQPIDKKGQEHDTVSKTK